jgi:hypothetical protein
VNTDDRDGLMKGPRRHRWNALRQRLRARLDRSGLQRGSASAARLVSRWSKIWGWVVASCGLLVLGGWFLDLPTLKSVLPGLATMKANTAVGFVLMGAGVVLLHRAARWPTYGCGLAAALLGALHMAEFLLDKDLGIDELLVRESSASVLTVFPGRMSLTTAVAFVLTGSALCLLRSKHAAVRRLADVLAGATAVIGILALSGYLYQAPALYHGVSVSMAVHTAALFSLLALALLTAPPVRGIAAILISDDVGGVLARESRLSAREASAAPQARPRRSGATVRERGLEPLRVLPTGT